MPLRSLGRLLGYDLAVDPGSQCVRVLAAGGEIAEIPSLVAKVDPGRAAFLRSEPVGEEARALAYSKRPGVEIIHPIERGAVAYPDAAEKLFAHVFQEAPGTTWSSRPRVICGVGAGMTQVEQQAFADVFDRAGARRVSLVPSLAACAYALDHYAQTGRWRAGRGDAGSVHLIAELGYGRTGVGLASRSGVLASRYVPFGAADLDLALAGYLRRRGLLASTEEATRLRRSLGLPAGSPCREGGPPRSERLGDVEQVLPRHVGAALAPFLELLADSIREILSAAPHSDRRAGADVVEDLLDEGLVLAGAPAATPGLAEAVSGDLELPAHVAPEPASLRVRGLALLAEDEELLDEVGVRV